jgi:alkylhydroperoxidase family enzyme
VTVDRLPRIDAPVGHEGSLDPGTYIGGHLPGYAGVLRAFGTAAMRQEGLGPATLEVARLRNAARMQCRLCMNLRRQSAVDDGLDEAVVSRLADRDVPGITSVDQTVLDLVDAYLEAPAAVPPAVIEGVRSQVTDAQLAQLLLSLVVWTGNRVLVALGLDAPVEADRVTMFDHLPSGAQNFVRTTTTTQEKQHG